MQGKTIAAISTPPGVGGIGVIRISGEQALAVADRCFRAYSGRKLSELPGYAAAYGVILSGREDEAPLDDGHARTEDDLPDVRVFEEVPGVPPPFVVEHRERPAETETERALDRRSEEE